MRCAAPIAILTAWTALSLSGAAAAAAPSPDAGAPTPTVVDGDAGQTAVPSAAADATLPPVTAPAPVVVDGDAGQLAAPTAAGDAALPPAPVAAPAPVDDAAEPRRELPSAPPPVPFLGRVLAKGTRAPLGASTVVIDLDLVTETDAAGRFSVELSPGRHRLQIQQPGHDVLDTTIHVGSQPAGESIFRLAPRLTGERYETVVVPRSEQASRIVLTGDDLVHTPGAFGDPIRAIESMPGLSQVVWPLALYAVRGANPGNTGFFLDGLRVPAMFHFALGPSIVNPYLLESISFYPGGYPADYGRYISGAVIVETTAPPRDRLHASADVRLLDAGGIITTPFNHGRGTVAVAGRYAYTGPLVALTQPDLRYGYWDYQLRVDHPFLGGALSAFAFGSSDDLSYAGTGGFEAALSFHRVGLSWYRRVAGGSLRVLASVGRDYAHTLLLKVPISITTISAAPRVTWSRAFGRSVELAVGADAEAQRFDPTRPSSASPANDLANKRDALSAGGFATLTLRAGKRLVLVPGFRYDAFFEQDTHKLEPQPRFKLRLQTLPDVWLVAEGGRFAQMASLPLSVPGFEGFGLKTFGTQTSLQISGGVEAPVWAGQVDVQAKGFYQYFPRIIDLSSIFNRDPLSDAFFDPRKGESYGLELLLRRPSSHRLHGWISYTLSWSRRLISGMVQPAEWDQRHILNTVATYRLGGGYSLGAAFHLNSGRWAPDTGVFPVAYMRLPTFYRVDLRADRRFTFDKFILDAYVELGNANFGREVFGVYTENGQRSYEGLPPFILPSLGVHGEF